MPSGKPRPHRGAATQRHVTAVMQRVRDAEGRTLEGWRELTSRDALPQMEELRKACMGLLEASSPLKGRNLDTSRGGGDFISSDGRSTVEGRSTMSYRDKQKWLANQLENVLRSIADLQEGGRRYSGGPRKRCANESCRHREWQKGIYQFCGYCGAAMEEAA